VPVDLGFHRRRRVVVRVLQLDCLEAGLGGVADALEQRIFDEQVAEIGRKTRHRDSRSAGGKAFKTTRSWHGRAAAGEWDQRLPRPHGFAALRKMSTQAAVTASASRNPAIFLYLFEKSRSRTRPPLPTSAHKARIDQPCAHYRRVSHASRANVAPLPRPVLHHYLSSFRDPTTAPMIVVGRFVVDGEVST
jgi:hypothetical protein